jgi:hypothetical protein
VRSGTEQKGDTAMPQGIRAGSNGFWIYDPFAAVHLLNPKLLNLSSINYQLSAINLPPHTKSYQTPPEGRFRHRWVSFQVSSKAPGGWRTPGRWRDGCCPRMREASRSAVALRRFPRIQKATRCRRDAGAPRLARFSRHLPPVTRHSLHSRNILCHKVS